MKSFIKKLGTYGFVQYLIGFIVYVYVYFVFITCKWEKIGLDNHKKDFPGLFAFWHSRILLIPLLTKVAKMDKPLKAMVSKHRDGRLITIFLKLSGVATIDGSTNHGGMRAGFETVRHLKKKESYIGLCPDGPRGPAYELGKGTIALAKMAKVPIYSMTYAVKKHKILRTWDKFMLPLPFSKGVMIMSEPFYVNEGSDDEGLENLRVEFQKIMNDDMEKAMSLVKDL